MCKELPDNEIRADEMEDYIEWRKGYAIADGQIEDGLLAQEGPQPIEFSDVELEDMNKVWQEALRGCVFNG